jgi:hypothetical protein
MWLHIIIVGGKEIMEQIFTDIGIYLLQMVVFIAVIYGHLINYFKVKRILIMTILR